MFGNKRGSPRHFYFNTIMRLCILHSKYLHKVVDPHPIFVIIEGPMDPQLRHLIEKTASEYLENGRKDWDFPHTKAVVKYAMEIASTQNLDRLVTFTAAWFHDTGYAGLFETSNSSNMQNILDRKKLHMLKGAEYVREFMQRPEITSFYTDEQKQRIIHLVSVHDKLRELKAIDEIVLMEADTLGALDPEGGARNLDKASQKRHMQGVMKARWPRFRTELGKRYFKEILQKT